MALRGTLRDFGIADIFQLIGHQAKTGILLLTRKDTEVRISFISGNVVAAEQTVRNEKERLGTVMRRAGVLTEEQLKNALDIQGRTLRRLGDVVADAGYTDRETVREFARLQTTETIYSLFHWKTGTYEFSQENVDRDPDGFEPIRSESILMEGFRLVDEWPAVRKIVRSNRMTVRVLGTMPSATSAEGPEDDDEDYLAGIDEAFSAMEAGEPSGLTKKPEFGESDHAVFDLIRDGVTVQWLVDVSRLGEFETCKSLKNLSNAGVIALDLPADEEEAQSRISVGDIVTAIVPYVTRIATYVVVAATVGGLVYVANQSEGGVLSTSRAATVGTDAVVLQAGVVSEAALRRRLNAFRLEHGAYPRSLDELLVEGAARETEVSPAFSERFDYRLTNTGYVLAPPFR